LTRTTSHFRAQSDDLERLRAATGLRQLAPRTGRDFSSNDYLGLAASSELVCAVRDALDSSVPVGAGGSRLLRGNHEEHERLEHEAAAFFGRASALYFSSGYGANSALFSTLPQRGDLVIHDALIHASAHEGLRLSRAERASARHNDVGHMEEIAREWRARGGKGRIWIAAESLYSMDGDLAPLTELAALAEWIEAILVIDEAHSTGVYGSAGRGLAHCLDGREYVITLHTCGKALGCEGALVCGPKIVKDFLVNRGRGFIFTTAPSPLMAAAVRASLKIVGAASELRERLHARAALARDLAQNLGFGGSESQIVPIVLGDDERTMAVAGDLQAAGFDVRGIRPPTVPRGTSRLRVSITLNVSDEDIRALFCALAKIL
jgi:8-amino-7-oxononanoate synthase